MKKVLFFTENNWVFGKIHNELIKALYPDIYCDILDYTISHDIEEMKLYLEKYDFFVSNPWGAYLLYSKYNIPVDKLIAIAHGELDIHVISKNGPNNERYKDLNFINSIRGYAVVSPFVYNLSINSDITRKPEILRIGLNTELYRCPKKTKLTTLGYLGSINVNYGHGNIKRGYLAQQLANLTNLNLTIANSYNFLAVEPLYKNIDMIVFCSLTEGNPYSALEAFAAGIPVIGTPVGIFPELAESGGGKMLPFNPHEFLYEGMNFINELKNNNSLYLDMCEKAAEYSQNIDWNVRRNNWINYIYSL